MEAVTLIGEIDKFGQQLVEVRNRAISLSDTIANHPENVGVYHLEALLRFAAETEKVRDHILAGMVMSEMYGKT